MDRFITVIKGDLPAGQRWVTVNGRHVIVDESGKPVDGSKIPSSEGKPAADKPSGEKPSGEKPDGEKPSGEKPSKEPSSEKPKEELITTENVTNKFKEHNSIVSGDVKKENIDKIHATNSAVKSVQKYNIVKASFDKHETEFKFVDSDKLSDGRIGTYESAGGNRDINKDTITLTTKDKITTHDLSVGKNTQNVGKDMESVARHEIGHKVLARADLTSGMITEWKTVSTKFNNRMKSEYVGSNYDKAAKHEQYGKNISRYSAKGGDELFAESFAAFTSPKYGEGSKLPPEIDGFMSKWIK